MNTYAQRPLYGPITLRTGRPAPTGRRWFGLTYAWSLARALSPAEMRCMADTPLTAYHKDPTS